MYRPLAAALLIFLATLQAVTVNTTETHDTILAAVDARDHGAAVAELIDLEKRDPKSFVSNEYDYLLARTAEADGDLALAMVNYQRVVSRGSVLAPYALMHLSEAARSTGNLLLERLFLSQLRLFYPDSLLAAGAMNRLARSSFESGNYSETIRILTSVDIAPKKGSSSEAARRGLALLGEAYMRSGVPDKAREIFAGLIDKMPDPAQPDDAGMDATGGLDELDGVAKIVIFEAEHIRRAGIYQSHRDFARAKLHYEAVIANDRKGQNAADAAFQIGRGLVQQANFVEASQWFERVLEQFPAQTAARDALLQAASAYARVGKPKEAIKRYQRFIEAYPTDEKLDRAYLNIVDIFRDQGEDSEALKWCVKTRNAFPGKLPATLALFDEVRIYITHDDWPAALSGLERLATVGDLGGTTVPGGTNSAEITFLKAYALEQMGRFAEAVDIYLSIPDGRGEYYGWRATDHLRALANVDSARGFILQKLGASLTGLKAKDAETA